MEMAHLPFETTILVNEDDKLYWPKEVTADAYTLVYYHSELQIEKLLRPLNLQTLYEAWAFDGKHSWHIWQRDEEWVCTAYHPSVLKEEEKMEVEHYLSKHIIQKIKKTKLIIHQTIAWDEDGQAHIAYSCPINFK